MPLAAKPDMEDARARALSLNPIRAQLAFFANLYSGGVALTGADGSDSMATPC
jgi:hypothetical protein